LRTLEPAEEGGKKDPGDTSGEVPHQKKKRGGERGGTLFVKICLPSVRPRGRGEKGKAPAKKGREERKGREFFHPSRLSKKLRGGGKEKKKRGFYFNQLPLMPCHLRGGGGGKSKKVFHAK